MPNESSWIKFFNFSLTLNLQWFMLVAQHFGHRPYPEFWNDGLYIMQNINFISNLKIQFVSACRELQFIKTDF